MPIPSDYIAEDILVVKVFHNFPKLHSFQTEKSHSNAVPRHIQSFCIIFIWNVLYRLQYTIIVQFLSMACWAGGQWDKISSGSANCFVLRDCNFFFLQLFADK